MVEASQGGWLESLAQQNALALSSSSRGSGLSSTLGLCPSCRREGELTFIDVCVAIKKMRIQGFAFIILQEFHACI